MPQQQRSEQSTSLTIGDKGGLKQLDYSDLVIYHQGDSWFGCSVGFRAMQVAQQAFPKSSPWTRENLYVISAHPGPGVKDAINLVTQCVTRQCFRLLDEKVGEHCSRDMKFEWWVSHGETAVHIKLHDDIVPDEFYCLLDRLNTEQEKPDDRQSFDAYKTDLSQQLWHQTLDESFTIDILPKRLKCGELPNA